MQKIERGLHLCELEFVGHRNPDRVQPHITSFGPAPVNALLSSTITTAEELQQLLRRAMCLQCCLDGLAASLNSQVGLGGEDKRAGWRSVWDTVNQCEKQAETTDSGEPSSPLACFFFFVAACCLFKALRTIWTKVFVLTLHSFLGVPGEPLDLSPKRCGWQRSPPTPQAGCQRPATWTGTPYLLSAIAARLQHATPRASSPAAALHWHFLSPPRRGNEGEWVLKWMGRNQVHPESKYSTILF